MKSRLFPIKRSKFEKFLKYVGCYQKRVKGDHIIYTRRGLRRPVIFPYDKEIPPFIIRTNLRTLGLTTKEFLDILEQM